MTQTISTSRISNIAKKIIQDHSGDENLDYMSEIKQLLKKYTGHHTVVLKDRGNSAILNALECAKKLNPGNNKVLIPNQGGWFTYRKYPALVGLDIEEIKTNAGIINPSLLAKKAKGCCALLYQTPAGYFAEQDIEKIYAACKKIGNKCLVILDVTGAIVDPKLCNGKFADILLGSFGKWKPVNLGYGGFISFGEGFLSYCAKNKMDMHHDFDNRYAKELCEKLKQIPQRMKFLYDLSKKVKKELEHYDVVHPSRKGINVIVRYKDEDEKSKIISYCENNKYEFTLCPRYIRIDEPAISIELKRL